ncbi:MAG: hypothetical protein ABIS26_00070 [Candidatus Paceibacterota bacterium]
MFESKDLIKLLKHSIITNMKRPVLIIIILAITLGAFLAFNHKGAVAPVVIPEEHTITAETKSANVENYIRTNIVTLSPVPAVVGGTWYVVSVTTDPEKSSGTVVYEDGHIQENKSFIYTMNNKGEVESLTIIK